MRISTNVVVNKKIMALIKSKYPEDFPGAYNTPESRYYRRLNLDTEEAEQYLKNNKPK